MGKYERVSQREVDPSAPSRASARQSDGSYVGHGGAGHRFRCGPESAPTRGNVAIIVGAGPAGVHMASMLKEVGVTPVLLEAEHRVGGKSFSVVMDDVVHEMGTCYAHPEYHVPKALFAKYGMAADLIRPGGVTGDRDFFWDDVPGRHGAATFTSLATWHRAAVREHLVAKSGSAKCLPGIGVSLAFVQAARKYQRLHKECMGSYYGALPPRPSAAQWARMRKPFAAFLAEHGCEALIPLLIIGQTTQGYGFLESVPTFYGLMWFSADLMEAFIAYASDKAHAEPVLTMLRGGWSKLWQRMVAQDRLDVRLGHRVTSIVRSASGVTVKGVATKSAHPGGGRPRGGGRSFTVRGTHVFIACPYAPIARALALTELEKRVISSLAPLGLTTTLYERDPRPSGGQAVIAYLPDRADPTITPRANPLAINCERWSERSIRPTREALAAGAPAGRSDGERMLANFTRELHAADLCENAEPALGAVRPTPGAHVCVGYQLTALGEHRRPADGAIDGAALRSALEADLRAQGVSGVRVLQQKPWDYFYQFSQEGLEKGLPWDLLEAQGENRTFWLGSSACFESVNDVTNYNMQLIHHFYGPETASKLSTGAKQHGRRRSSTGAAAIRIASDKYSQ